MRLAGATGSAVAAIHVHFGADEITGLETADFVADLLDRAAKFMAEGHRRANARGGPFVPVINVKIGAADGSGADADESVGGTECGNGNGFELRALFGAGLTQSFHNRVRLR